MKKMLFPLALALGLLAAPAVAQARDNTPPRPAPSSFLGGPRLGVQVVSLTDELRAFYGAAPDTGVLVGKIEPSSAAAQAGVHVGDVLVSVAGVKVSDAVDVRRALSAKKEGEVVPIDVVRERKPLTLSVRVPKPSPEAFRAPGEMQLQFPDNGELRAFGGLQDLDARLKKIEQRLDKLEQH